jgi:hypothetical protein
MLDLPPPHLRSDDLVEQALGQVNCFGDDLLMRAHVRLEATQTRPRSETRPIPGCFRAQSQNWYRVVAVLAQHRRASIA